MPSVMAEDTTDVSWNHSLEKLIAEEGEKCTGLAWLYRETERYYSRNNTIIALPVIILSSLTGFVSGSSQTLFPDPTIASIGLGGVSVFTAILSTVGSYFAWAKRSEASRISALQYSKLQKVIEIEMRLPKNERIRAKDMLKMIRDNVERLLETSPMVPPHIIEQYRRKFVRKDVHDSERVAHPEITNGVHKIEINSAAEYVPTPVLQALEDEKTHKSFIRLSV